MKKNLLTFIIVGVVSLIAIPTANISLSVKRNLEINISNIKGLYTLDAIIGEINLFYKQYEVSSDNNVVITGKDGFLFLGNNYDRVTDLHRGFLNKNDEISITVPELKNKQDYFDQLSIDSAFIIAPDKYTTYRDKLPSWLITTDDTPVYQFLSRADEAGLKTLFLKDYIKNDELLTFYKTDTHWNTYGAYLGYNATIDFLNTSYGSNIKKVSAPVFLLTERHGGDLSKFAKYSNSVTDYEAEFDKSDLSQITKCSYNISEMKHYGCINETNSFSYTNDQAFYTKNENALNKKKILYLKDSFGTANSIFYQETFSETIQVHYNNLQGDNFLKLVIKEKPDIIIYQVVERGFYSAGYSRPWNSDVIELNYASTIPHISSNLREDDFNNYIDVSNLTANRLDVATPGGDPSLILKNTDNHCLLNTLHVDINSSVDGQLQLFYKTNHSSGYNEKDSYRISIKKGDNKFSLMFSSNVNLEQLRFDLPEEKGEFFFNDLSFSHSDDPRNGSYQNCSR